MASNPADLRRTPLFQEHVKLGARMIEFGGWTMPVFYAGIMTEHQAVRNRVGMFDISHMGQLEVSGTAATKWLNTLLTNNLQKLSVGEGQYTLILNERGGVIDDLIVFRRTEARFSVRRRQPRRSGSGSLSSEGHLGSSPAGSVPETLCGWRLAILSMVQTSRNRGLRWKPAWDTLSIWRKLPLSAAKPCSRRRSMG
jgi:hypothetical protein